MGPDDRVLMMDGAFYYYDAWEDEWTPCNCITTTTLPFTVESVKGTSIIQIKNVIFHPPATIVFWEDGTKTVCKVKEGEIFDRWTGLAMCICKKMMGSETFHHVFKTWCNEEDYGPLVTGTEKVMTPSEIQKKMDFMINAIAKAFKEKKEEE